MAGLRCAAWRSPHPRRKNGKGQVDCHVVPNDEPFEKTCKTTKAGTSRYTDISPAIAASDGAIIPSTQYTIKRDGEVVFSEPFVIGKTYNITKLANKPSASTIGGSEITYSEWKASISTTASVILACVMIPYCIMILWASLHLFLSLYRMIHRVDMNLARLSSNANPEGDDPS